MSLISTPFRGGRISRRELLQVGALGALGLALPQLLRAEATRSAAREMSCILIFPFGGPATQDIFDLKPDAPAEVRGEFQPIATSVPGIRIAEHLPKLARVAQFFSIVRSVSHGQTDHDPAAHYVLTGGRQKVPGFPATGSVLSLLWPTRRTLPSYVLLPANLVNVKGVVGGQHAGFLGAVHNPFAIAGDPSQPRFQVPNLNPAHEVDSDRLTARRALLDNIDARAQHLGHTVAGQNLGGYYERAYDLVSSSQAKQAFDLSREPDKSRDRYGRTMLGQSMLMARRLVEAGVRLVLVNDASETGENTRYDTHGIGRDPPNFPQLRKVLPETDAALTALLQDLHNSGRLDTTLVVWIGEMGRTPRINKTGGRDHWPHCYSALLAGGGVRGGQVYGSSDAQAAQPRESPCSPADIQATIFHCLGVDREATIADQVGRPLPLFEGTPLRTLLR